MFPSLWRVFVWDAFCIFPTTASFAFRFWHIFCHLSSFFNLPRWLCVCHSLSSQHVWNANVQLFCDDSCVMWHPLSPRYGCGQTELGNVLMHRIKFLSKLNSGSQTKATPAHWIVLFSWTSPQWSNLKVMFYCSDSTLCSRSLSSCCLLSPSSGWRVIMFCCKQQPTNWENKV